MQLIQCQSSFLFFCSGFCMFWTSIRIYQSELHEVTICIILHATKVPRMPSASGTTFFEQDRHRNSLDDCCVPRTSAFHVLEVIDDASWSIWTNGSVKGFVSWKVNFSDFSEFNYPSFLKIMQGVGFIFF